jgi:ABC-type branched-subunit amino acid transport system substrate-binding protein
MITKEARVVTRRRPLRIALALGTCVVLAACGSQVPPKEFINDQGNLGGNGTASNGAANNNGGGNNVVPGNNSTNTIAPGATGTNTIVPGGTTTTGGTGHTGTGSTGGGSTGGGAVAGVKAGSCAGFKNTTGITNSTITISNVADLSGPVPGLFKSAQAAVTAYVAYFNSTSSICGRKLKVIGLDSGTSESADQQADTSACSDSFAQVGSMGAFDAGGAATAAACGIPDLRTASTETARYKSPVSYGVYSLAVPEVQTPQFTYFKSLGSQYKKAAFVYLNAGASSLNAKSFIAAEKKMGFVFKDTIAIDVTSVPNYGAIATQLKGDGVQYVQYIGAASPYAVQLKSAMAQANYNPIFAMDPTGYDPAYVAGGSPVEGTYSFVPGPLFEEASKNPQLQTYLTWLQHTSGGNPTFFGVYAWTAAALFTQLAIQLGGKLTRASLLQAIRGINNYTNNGMVPPQSVGSKTTPKCASVVQLVHGKWVRKTPYPYTCGSLVNSGVGG